MRSLLKEEETGTEQQDCEPSSENDSIDMYISAFYWLQRSPPGSSLSDMVTDSASLLLARRIHPRRVTDDLLEFGVVLHAMTVLDRVVREVRVDEEADRDSEDGADEGHQGGAVRRWADAINLEFNSCSTPIRTGRLREGSADSHLETNVPNERVAKMNG